jgi:hypothetical protein
VQGIPTGVVTGQPTGHSRPSASNRPSFRRRRPATRRRSAPGCIIRRSCVVVHTPPRGGIRVAAPWVACCRTDPACCVRWAARRRPHIVTASCAPRRPHSYAALRRRGCIGWREHGRVDRLALPEKAVCGFSGLSGGRVASCVTSRRVHAAVVLDLPPGHVGGVDGTVVTEDDGERLGRDNSSSWWSCGGCACHRHR